MIIVCKNCKASFLVPDTTFKKGARTLRCAKCQHTWREEPPHKNKPFSPAPSAQPFIETLPTQPLQPPEKTEETSATPFSSPARLHKIKHLSNSFWSWKEANKLLSTALFLSTGFLLLVLITLLAAHGPIIRTWPDMQGFYVTIGWAEAPLQDKLILQNIVPERRYMDGGMHLVVQGEIASQAEKTQVIPDINIEALGPDQQIIQSWRIKPPQATLDPKTRVPFTSSILSPEGTVVEVNLSFVEPPHDEP